MSKINKLMAEVATEMNCFNATLKGMLADENPLIVEAVNYILASQGKQVRPLLMILSAKLNGEINDKTYLAGCLIELTHCASLIHDDIVDEAYMRRGMLSMYAIWRNKNSILIGDYIFSRAIKIACQNKLYDLLNRISGVIENMSVGELEQSDTATKLNITESKYYEIINGKTAELISACSHAGALTCGAEADKCDSMSEFGRVLGMIFQIKDDMLDYRTGDATGKNSCNDIREQKITLPLIIALNNCDEKKRKKILAHIAKASKDESSVKVVFEAVINSSGMEYCENKLQELRKDAMDILSAYPDSPNKNSLIELMDYFIERKK